jgi:hypothetical protein
MLISTLESNTLLNYVESWIVDMEHEHCWGMSAEWLNISLIFDVEPSEYELSLLIGRNKVFNRWFSPMVVKQTIKIG